jgi:hypothetical protein
MEVRPVLCESNTYVNLSCTRNGRLPTGTAGFDCTEHTLLLLLGPVSTKSVVPSVPGLRLGDSQTARK